MSVQNRGQGRGVKEVESYIQITTTTDKKEVAERIAFRLVEEKLAACVQIVGPITSIYRWKENIERAEEWQCIIKSREGLYKEIELVIKSVHSYEVPEIIAIPIVAGSGEYLEWLQGELI
jgi:periplasmic divalent cation tolerance protein